MFAIWKLTGPDYKKLIPAVLMIAALRDQYTPKRQPPTPEEGGWLRWVLLTIIVVIVYAVWPPSSTQIPPSPQAVSAQPARPPAANPEVKPATQTAPEKHRAAVPAKPQKQGDLRRCLSLKNDAEIARCTEGH